MKNNEFDYERHYEKFHSDNKEHIKEQLRYNYYLLSSLKDINRDINVLEIGCGRGYTMMTLRKMGFHNVFGIDIDKSQTKYCKHSGLNVELVDDTIDFLAKHTSEYDLVIAFDVLEHMDKNELICALKGIYAALRPEGKVICKVPNANHPLSMRYRYIDWTHYMSFTECSLDFVLYNTGFRNIKVFEEPYVPQKMGLKYFISMIIRNVNRFYIRMMYLLEFGKKGFDIPITLNIMATAEKSL